MRTYVEPQSGNLEGVLWRDGEVEIIRSKRMNFKILFLVFTIIAALAFLAVSGAVIGDRWDDYDSHEHSSYCYTYVGGYSDLYNDLFSNYYDYYDYENNPNYELNCWYRYWDSASDYALEYYGEEVILPLLAMVAGWMLIPVILWLLLSRCEMVVTNYRVCGRGWFGRRVDLPLDAVSATGTVRWLRRVSVSTGSGWISFGFISNSDRVFSVLTQTVIERQRLKGQVSAPAAVSATTADDVAVN